MMMNIALLLVLFIGVSKTETCNANIDCHFDYKGKDACYMQRTYDGSSEGFCYGGTFWRKGTCEKKRSLGEDCKNKAGAADNFFCVTRFCSEQDGYKCMQRKTGCSDFTRCIHKWDDPTRGMACLVECGVGNALAGTLCWDYGKRDYGINNGNLAMNLGRCAQNSVTQQWFCDTVWHGPKSSVSVAAPINDILTRLDHRILAFGGVFVAVAIVFFLRARKQAQEDNVYSVLMNSTEPEI